MSGIDFTTLSDKAGAFVRKDSSFRDFITADGQSGFKAENGRYHMYVSLACPWAHRALIMLKLKGLNDVIKTTVVDWFMGKNGWQFTDKKPKTSLDTVNGCKYLKEVYHLADPNYSQRNTVPCLWDKQKKTIVNNESSEILRMLNTEFNAFCETEEQRKLDVYPEHLRTEINFFNSWIYPKINNGVYKCGFATKQEAYDTAVHELFEALDKVEGVLTASRFLTGSELTEADIRLFTTLIRFDWVYNTHFKCNKKRIVDYPNTWAFVRDIYQIPGVSDTVDKEHIMKHYYISHDTINPSQIVAIGPDLDLNDPPMRDHLA